MVMEPPTPMHRRERKPWYVWPLSAGLVLLFGLTLAVLAANRERLNLPKLLLYLLVLGIYLLGEAWAHQPPQPGGRRAPDDLRYVLSLSWFALAIGSPLAYALWPYESPAATLLGVLLTLAGLLLRVWAVRSLQGYFSRRIQTWPDQPVVQTGPYRWIRHPAYAGNLLQTLGMPLVLAAFPALPGSLWVMALFLRRLALEEAYLQQHLPGYRMYMRKTKRLIPGVW